MRLHERKLNRKQFIKQAGFGLLGFLLSACRPIVLTAGRGSRRMQTPFQSLTVTSQPAMPTTEPTATFCVRQFPALVSEEEAAFLAAHEIQEGDTGREK